VNLQRCLSMRLAVVGALTAVAACGTSPYDGVPTTGGGSHVLPARPPAARAVIEQSQGRGLLGIVPVELRIPSVGIAASVEPVAETSTGDLAVPAEWRDVGWFSLGVLPGENGNAVMIGHLDTDMRDHPEAAFSSLHRVGVGAAVLVDGRGATVRFVVTSVRTYAVGQFPLSDVFGGAGVPRLRLITCAGTWRGPRLGYSERLVVTADEP
jgi:sortase (surface protein transpeptidase)